MKFTTFTLLSAALLTSAKAADFNSYSNTTSTSSTASPSESIQPVLSLDSDNGLKFQIVVPIALGPWSSVSITQDSPAGFEWSGKGTFSLDGTAAPISEVYDTSDSDVLDEEYLDYPSTIYTDLIYNSPDPVFPAEGGSFTLTVTLALNDVAESKFMKRATKTYVLSLTVNIPATSSSASGASGATTASSSVITGVTAKSGSVVTDQTTTVLTVTSCSDHHCTAVPVTTGVTDYTTTVHGTATVVTTYCPLTAETKAPVATTVFETVTCTKNVCKKTAVTTGVTTVTSTNKKGVVTVYTTYCPLTAEETSTAKAASESATATLTTAVTTSGSATATITTAVTSSASTGSVKPTATSSKGAISTYTGGAASQSAAGIFLGSFLFLGALLM
ncbi:hypothetical protein FOA43_004542 [Brettanomyces nanus]|uniref:Uncharacterized protein n=1 Tax=Eeniella nana TaxID=13502 RepID=A0A875S881_EENNA|nr:uncharacterized protein FOA43_004542 [Brettanomyces nanus]QPG77138.1 hypothetical protein FOA43_004542 [Brettanomyces nanus]